MKALWKALLALLYIGTPMVIQAQDNRLPILGEAPELHEGIWLNTTTPLTLANLRGKVVLLEMWTFDCINCIHTLPTIQAWHESYAEQGLVVIGNHYPEFDYEANLDNLRAAITRFAVSYPILQDNQRETWSAYNNRYWPTMYLIDKQGQIRYVSIGEGRYERTENAIQALLAESYTSAEDETSEAIWSLTPIDVLNVRSGAGTEFPRIGLIYPNEAYYILEEQDGWYRINFDGAEAYVSGEFVTVTEAEESD